MYYNWNRYYDPRLGRDIQFDPLGVTPNLAGIATINDVYGDGIQSSLKTQMTNASLRGGLNQPYAYVGSNPLRWIDPLGLKRVKVAEQIGGIWQFWYMDVFNPRCGDTPGGCSTFRESYRTTWTAEASDSCVFDRFATQIFNGPWQWFATHVQWWQVTFTEYKYKSNDKCGPCTLTDIRGEHKESYNPHPGDETLQR